MWRGRFALWDCLKVTLVYYTVTCRLARGVELGNVLLKVNTFKALPKSLRLRVSWLLQMWRVEDWIFKVWIM